MRSTNETSIRLHLESLDEGGFVATSPDVPGLVAEGRSAAEAVEIAQGLTRRIIESCIEHGDALPLRFGDEQASAEGFDLTVPVGLA